MKACNKCQKCKPLNSFHKTTKTTSGHTSICRACHNITQKDWYAKNKERERIKRRDYYNTNKEKLKPYRKSYYEANKSRLIKIGIALKKKKRQTDPIAAIVDRVRRRINQSLKNKGVLKEYKTLKYVGCDWIELRQHLESQFATGMCWKTRHLWHIDHIIPLALFDLRKEEERMFAFSYVNLQPLWAHENLAKGGR